EGLEPHAARYGGTETKARADVNRPLLRHVPEDEAPILGGQRKRTAARAFGSSGHARDHIDNDIGLRVDDDDRSALESHVSIPAIGRRDLDDRGRQRMQAHRPRNPRTDAHIYIDPRPFHPGLPKSFAHFAALLLAEPSLGTL